MLNTDEQQSCQPVLETTVHPEDELRRLNLFLPPYPAPTANYAQYRLVGDMLYLAGQNPRLHDGTLCTGKLGHDLTTEEGYVHARHVGLNLLAVAAEALGDLDRVAAVVKVFGMVNATPDFTEHPKVVNGCSDLMVSVFGRERGIHPRSAVGFVSLPFGISVEIEAVMQVRL